MTLFGSPDSEGERIAGAYGSSSDAVPPTEIADFLESAGFAVVRRAEDGVSPITKFAWIDA